MYMCTCTCVHVHVGASTETMCMQRWHSGMLGITRVSAIVIGKRYLKRCYVHKTAHVGHHSCIVQIQTTCTFVSGAAIHNIHVSDFTHVHCHMITCT